MCAMCSDEIRTRGVQLFLSFGSREKMFRAVAVDVDADYVYRGVGSSEGSRAAAVVGD